MRTADRAMATTSKDTDVRQTTRLLIHGANGRMGQALIRLCHERADCEVVAAVSARAPAQRVVDGVPWFSASELTAVPAFDVAVDFSLPAGFDAVLSLCASRRAGLVSGTTGISDAQRASLQAAAAHIAVVWASNFSLGVAVLDDLVEPEWPEGHDEPWGAWSPLRGRLFPGTAIFVCRKPR